ncbi:MAG TPA: hypothetical protein VE777_01890 [Gaiellales bacterium]|jgi:hypothetical protein|nr:hypothetical protein [Gaiellales bacterium]
MERASMPPGGRISNVRAEVSGRALAPVTFVLERAETAAVRCVVEHAVGVGSTTVEAPLEGGSKAIGELELDVRRLPHGPALLRLTALDTAGQAGTAGETQIVVPGCPGPGPTRRGTSASPGTAPSGCRSSRRSPASRAIRLPIPA